METRNKYRLLNTTCFPDFRKHTVKNAISVDIATILTKLRKSDERQQESRLLRAERCSVIERVCLQQRIANAVNATNREEQVAVSDRNRNDLGSLHLPGSSKTKNPEELILGMGRTVVEAGRACQNFDRGDSSSRNRRCAAEVVGDTVATRCTRRPTRQHLGKLRCGV